MEVYTISRFNALIKHTLEREFIFKNCYLTGTISNFTAHRNGHFYFSLKDDNASIDVTLWKNTAQSKNFVQNMKNGLEVTMRGTLNFYEKMGRLNLICNDMQIGEKSAYQMEFERLKQELQELGYFDSEAKQELPVMSTCIAIVTSESGAVLHDILNVARTRNPLVQFKLFSVPVQGDKAGSIIAKGIAMADADSDIDLIIVGRGGGSMEDLWCFNDRTLVETIYNTKKPVISAVGHETDFTLCDFVADMRASTPSHAAELSVFPITQLQTQLNEYYNYLNGYVDDVIHTKHQELDALFNRRLVLPIINLLNQQQSLLQKQEQHLHSAIQQTLLLKKNELKLYGERLQLLNPLTILLKGYSKIEKDKQPITSITQLDVDDSIHLTLSDGQVQAMVKEITTDGK